MKRYLAFIKEKKDMITNIKTDNIKKTEIEKIFRKKFEQEILQSIYKKTHQMSKTHKMSKTDIQAALNANEFIKACQDKWDDIIEPPRINLANVLTNKNLITGTVSNVLAAIRLANAKRLAAAAEQKRLADEAAEQQRLAAAAEQQRLADEAATEQKRLAAALAGQKQKANRGLNEASERKKIIDEEKQKQINDFANKEAQKSLEARDRRIALQQQHEIERKRKNSSASNQKPFSVPHVSKGGSSKTKKTHKNIEKNITRKKTYKPA